MPAAGLDAAPRLLWACVCGVGGVTFTTEQATAGQALEIAVAAHLREPGNGGHRAEAGRPFASATQDTALPPLTWSQP